MFSWCILVATLIFGMLGGGASSWLIQDWRAKGARVELQKFRDVGEAAQREASRQALRNLNAKERVDDEYQNKIVTLSADVKRMRDERAGRGYVPAAADTENPNVACFNREKLERAIQQFDAEVSGIVAEGANAIAALNAARVWASDIRPLDNSASDLP